MKRYIALIVLLVTTLVLASCSLIKSDEELIEDRIDEFCTSYNSGDFDATVECLDAKTRNTIKKTLSFASGLLGIFTDIDVDVSDLFSDFWGMSVGYVSEDDLLRIEIIEIDLVSKELAHVKAEMSYEDIYSSECDTVYIIMVREDDDWYIKDFADVSEIEENEEQY